VKIASTYLISALSYTSASDHVYTNQVLDSLYVMAYLFLSVNCK
jgi:hypothetical protein